MSTQAHTAKLNDNERRILRYLAGQWEDYYLPFAPITRATRLRRREVRLACRSLKRKGFAEFLSGLWCEYDDKPAGSGYRASKEGRNLFAKAEGRS